jgi:hypothetical protein
MKGLSTLERIILESIDTQELTHQQILSVSGLHPNVCTNLLQALVMRGFLRTNGLTYHINKAIPESLKDEVNCKESKHAESLEMIEATIDLEKERLFRLQKIALDEKDLKIFHAMLINLDSFLKEAHKKSQKDIPLKKRQVIFWGYSEVENLMNQLIMGGER